MITHSSTETKGSNTDSSWIVPDLGQCSSPRSQCFISRKRPFYRNKRVTTTAPTRPKDKATHNDLVVTAAASVCSSAPMPATTWTAGLAAAVQRCTASRAGDSARTGDGQRPRLHSASCASGTRRMAAHYAGISSRYSRARSRLT